MSTVSCIYTMLELIELLHDEFVIKAAASTALGPPFAALQDLQMGLYPEQNRLWLWAACVVVRHSVPFVCQDWWSELLLMAYLLMAGLAWNYVSCYYW